RNLLLNRDPRARGAPVKISLRGMEKVRVDIDRGFLITELSTTAPIFIRKDLSYGKEHQIMVRRGTSQKGYVCKFVPRSLSASNPYHLVIMPSGTGFTCKVYSK
ncbi:hypothetical protein N9D31_02460, partial [Oligoflexaceae bacterium]|nr:hypothetical protein [Oligoflexaceae bacterium]